MSRFKFPITQILFLDIETVPLTYQYDKLEEGWKELWDQKAKYWTGTRGLTSEETYAKAGIYAEFSKVVCISCGIVNELENDSFEIRIKSFSSEDEHQLLSDFVELLNQFYADGKKLLCAHNGKEFDFPFLARRILVNQIEMPAILDIGGMKPWEVQHLDTMQMWRFGDYKNFTSLNLLAKVFGIQSPKDEMDGSDVARVFYEENDLDSITNYCEKDVKTLIKVFNAIAYSGKLNLS